MEESRLVFGNYRHVGCILSLGTGYPGTIGLSKPDSFQRLLPLELIRTLKKIATNCEEIANKLDRKFLDCPGIYFRFNVNHGSEGVSLEEWKKMETVIGHTKAYLQNPTVSKLVDSVAGILCSQRGSGGLIGRGPITLGQICGYLPTLLPLHPAKPKKEPIFRVPFDRDLRFVGRKDVLQKIDDEFKKKRRVALCGIGGIGKSQIAIEFCYIWKEQHSDGHVFWIHASTRNRLEEAYRGLAQELGLDAKVDTLKTVVHWLNKKENGPWLLALDNANDIEMFLGSQFHASPTEGLNSLCIDLLPRNPDGFIIITTRDKRVGQRLTNREEIIIVEPFVPQDAKQLLRIRLPHGSNPKNIDVQNLLDILGFIPLAITQAAAFITENGITVAKYIEDLKVSDADLQDYLEEDLPDHRRDAASENSVIRTWKLSFDQIARQKPRAAELLSLIAVLDRQGIPETLLHRENERRIDFIKALGTLLAFSFITEEKGGNFFEVHRLVQLSTQKWLALQGKENEWQAKALELMAGNFPSGEYETWQMCRILVPHALAALRYDHLSKIMPLQRASLLEHIAGYVESQGQYDIAYPRYRETLQLRERTLGKDHPDTLRSMNNLALVLCNRGQYKEAEEIHRQTLQLREKVLGKDHPDTLRSMNNLASVLSRQGQYKEAEEIYRQTLQLGEKVLGKDHPDTLAVLFNLARTLEHLREFSEAETLFRLELERCETVYGPGHSQTIDSLDNLADFLEKQGNNAEAETLRQRIRDAEASDGDSESSL